MNQAKTKETMTVCFESDQTKENEMQSISTERNTLPKFFFQKKKVRQPSKMISFSFNKICLDLSVNQP